MSEENPDAVFGAKVGKGILYATPIMFILMIAVIWITTDMGLADSVRTGALPGVLFGVFAGGFIGTLGSVWNQH